ncbi:MAG: pilus assembly protein [Candidatus Omnitrophota bacterium]|nr:pilus assembly protein [Candidatus Omnitrophota bacterium]
MERKFKPKTKPLTLYSPPTPKPLDQKKGQVILEFSFSMMVVLLLMFGTIMVFRWTGLDLVARQKSHDALLFNEDLTPEEQIDPFFHAPLPMNATWVWGQ